MPLAPCIAAALLLLSGRRRGGESARVRITATASVASHSIKRRTSDRMCVCGSVRACVCACELLYMCQTQRGRRSDCLHLDMHCIPLGARCPRLHISKANAKRLQKSLKKQRAGGELVCLALQQARSGASPSPAAASLAKLLRPCFCQDSI